MSEIRTVSKVEKQINSYLNCQRTQALATKSQSLYFFRSQKKLGRIYIHHTKKAEPLQALPINLDPGGLFLEFTPYTHEPDKAGA